MRRVRIFRGAAFAAWMLLLVAAPQASAGGADVAALQAALQSKGLYRVAVDGVQGPLTARGVRSLQRRHGLQVDGIAGPKTRKALGPRGGPALGTRVIRGGQRGWDVAALQYLARRQGRSQSAVDGVFGQGTGAALSSFQRAAGLEVDGLAGPAAISALRRESGSSPVSEPEGSVRFLRPVPGRISDHFGAPRPGGRRHAGIVAAPSRHARAGRRGGHDDLRRGQCRRLRQPRGDPAPARVHQLVRPPLQDQHLGGPSGLGRHPDWLRGLDGLLDRAAPPLRGTQVERALRSAAHHAQHHRRSPGPSAAL